MCIFLILIVFKKESISILTHMKRLKGKCILQMFPVFGHYMKRNPAKNFDCNRDIYMYFVSLLTRENDVTLSYVVEMKADVIKQIKMTSRLSMQ